MKMSPILIIALAAGMTAAPALAGAKGRIDGLKVSYDAKRDKYCVSQEVTGQNIPQRTCKTKAEWAELGVVMGDKSDTKLAQGKEMTSAN